MVKTKQSIIIPLRTPCLLAMYVLQKCAPAKSLKKCNFGELSLNLVLLGTFKGKKPKWRFLEIVSEQVILLYAYLGLNHLLT